MRTFLTTVAVLASTAALGQTQQIQIRAPDGRETLRVQPTDCGRDIAFSWTVGGTLCDGLSLWLTRDSDCQDSASAQTTRTALTTIPVETIRNQGGQGTSSFQGSELPFPETDGGAACGALGQEVTFRLCGATKGADAFGTCLSTTTLKASPLRVLYDTLPPGPPSIGEVVALDESLRVTVDAPEDATQVRLAVLQGDTEVTSVLQTVEQGAFRVEDLQNNVAYTLRAYSIDEAGNVSEAFDEAEGTPIKTLGFYEEYLRAQGKETGGCGAAGGGVAGGAVLAVLGFWLSSRRKRS
ncbi:MAG TPA: MXAN_2561 family MXYO-CTERM-anchored protein [Myxococcaceae bacterium]|nr:MXAN_2561 family MXYO-CTERM-anchored protein [Myxococcaceae bacterium]